MSTLTPARNLDGRFLTFDTEAIFTLEPAPLSYLAEGVIVREALNLLAAREKTGKSLLALGLSLAIAKGERSYAGLRTEPGRVVYIDAENGIGESHRRIRRLSEMPAPPDHFQYVALGEHPFQLDHDDAVAQLDRLVSDFRPDLIVFDSFRSLWTGDENSPREASAVLDRLRNFLRGRGVAGLLLHHANAHGDLRGSTGIPASVENIVKMRAVARGERALVQLPSRFGEVLRHPVHYRIEARDDGPMAPLDMTAVASEPRETARPGDPRDDTEHAEAIRRLLADGQARSGKAIARALGRHETARSVRSTITALVAAGDLRRAGDGYTLARPVAI